IGRLQHLAVPRHFRLALLALDTGSAPAGTTRLVRHHHADRVGKLTHGLREIRPGMLHQETYGRTMRPAAKAVVELLARAYREGRTFFVMEGAQAEQVRASLAQLHIAPHHVGNIDTLEQALYEGIR